uniref:Uncharacterized protein n=1 Tax=Utricularia reniformis TaxID=192314 RepID=A0A1Y0B4X1_9LAMI|nr:hypothetical protein AEK19_MT0350 [Utricularia reniformis]YP_009382737.1 hypothetical protein AEK19_MT2304 [Utricularia reniformis]ART30622.1 hypothetical protein AEK19_MT0350 [Utricularia reniformis]ART32447.1 hypothetical protein AEK19_MT2304 [Utricularia reniformis]
MTPAQTFAYSLSQSHRRRQKSYTSLSIPTRDLRLLLYSHLKPLTEPKGKSPFVLKAYPAPNLQS